TDTATATSATFDPDTANNTATAATLFACADLALTKAGPPTASAGASATYTLTLTNTGPDPPTDMALTDVLPAGLALVSPPHAPATVRPPPSPPPSPPPVASGNPPAADRAPLPYPPPRASALPAPPTAPPPPSAPDAANNTATAATVVPPCADLTLTKAGPAT